MSQIERRTFLRGLGAAIALAPGVSLLSAGNARARASADPRLRRIDRSLLVTAEEARAWHAVKDSMGGPTIAGSPSWRSFLELCERELRGCGVVDVFRNPWRYSRWSTTEWPDDSAWSLRIGDNEVRVASYGCNSGSTSENGVTGQLVLYEEGTSAEALRGKIAIVVKRPPTGPVPRADAPPNASPPSQGGNVRTGDYEFLSDPETFPDPQAPRTEGGRLSPFGQMGLGDDREMLERAGALGALIVLGLSYDALAGLYTFPVPPLHQLPTLYLDRGAGAAVVEAARGGESVTLRLLGQTEESETYQLFAYLPGRHYGTERDEQILLITHTDGPSISQDNGALGILAMVQYFSRLAQSERPRSLLVFLDCRHYMPGMERAFASQDYAAQNPEVYQKVFAAMGIEHLGQKQVAESQGEPYHFTSVPELSTVWVTRNQRLVDWAIRAVQENRLRRVQVQCPGRPGIHGGEQGPWYGLGNITNRLGKPGISAMGSMTGYWSTRARLDALDAGHFVDQVATMTQLCGELMLAELAKIVPDDEGAQARG
jgi:hypothetical protein